MSAPIAAAELEPPRAGRFSRAGVRLRSSTLGWLAVAPLVIVVGVLIYYPVAVGFDMSLHDFRPAQSPLVPWVGLRNYRDALVDPLNRTAALHTLYYAAVAVVAELAMGTVFALGLNRPFRGRSLAIAALILPWALPSVVSALVWQRIFAPEGGLLNEFLMTIGVLDAPRAWLAGDLSAIVSISIIHVWTMLPFVTLIILAGLQGIPDSLGEAASVDGATPWRRFRHVTLPLLAPSVAIAAIAALISSFLIFDEIYTLLGAAFSTRSIMMELYQTTFVKLDFGRGLALAFLVTAAMVVASSGYLLLFRDWKVERVKNERTRP